MQLLLEVSMVISRPATTGGTFPRHPPQSRTLKNRYFANRQNSGDQKTVFFMTRRHSGWQKTRFL
jgi:hypothetical protein